MARKNIYRAGQSEGEEMLDRLPPHSAEAEAGVLGCCLLSPQECLGECVVGFDGEQMFYDLRHSAIYAALVRVWDRNEPVDIITLQEELKLAGQLEEVGGLSYVAALPDVVPSAANLSYYLEIVREKFLLRRLLQVTVEVQQRVYSWEGEVDGLLDGVEADIMKINRDRTSVSVAGMKGLVSGAIDRMEAMSRGVGLLGGIRTWFGYYDKMTGGLHRKEMIVLAGRPSAGKTSKAMNVVANVALRGNLPVGVFSLEMSAEDLTMRLICAEAEVNFHKLRTGFIADSDYPKLTNAAGKISRAAIYIDDTPALTILALRAKARRLALQFGIKLVVIDYLQLMKAPGGGRGQDRQQEIADISAGLKGLAKELDVPVLVLSQLNRESAKNKNRKPQLEDLRESGAIEQDADLVEILYRPMTEDFDPEAQDYQVNGLIAKQRNGPTGDVQYFFKRSCMRFEDGFANRGKVALPSDEEMGIGKYMKPDGEK